VPNIIGEAAYRVTADTSGFRRQAETGVGSAMRTIGRAGLIAGAAGIGAAFIGMGLAVRRGFNEFADSQRVMAQTRAVLKSTGGEAGVTAKHVTDLATSLSHMTGIDDETVQASENLLLTFTNVRNFVDGKFVGTFDDATRSIADVATAMAGRSGGELDLQGATIQVGKALQDPVRGMTALRRVGVNFSDSQQTLIKRLVDTGHTLEAQRIILKELHKEFGGSAEAAGNTLPGALNKLSNAFDEAMGSMVKTAAPAIAGILGQLTTFSEFLQRVFAHEKLSVRLKLLWEGAAGVASDLWDAFVKAWNGSSGQRTPVKVGGRIIDFEQTGASEGIKEELKTAIKEGIRAAFTDIDWGDLAGGLLTSLGDFHTMMVDATHAAFTGIGELITSFLFGDLGASFDASANQMRERFNAWVASWLPTDEDIRGWAASLSGFAVQAVTAIVTGFAGLVGRVGNIFFTLQSTILTRLGGLIAPAGGLAVSVVTSIVSKFISLAARVGGFVADMVSRGLGLLRGFVGSAGSAAQSIVNNIVNAFSGIAGKIGGKLATIGGTIHNALSSVANQAFGWASGLGARIAEGIASGIRGAAGSVVSAVGDVVGSALSKGGDLVPGSPRGPLEHAVEEHLTSRFVNAFTSGIAAGAPLMAAAIGGAVGAGTVEAGSSTTNNRTINVGQVILPTVTNGGDLVRQLDALVARPG
jgi:hypothetical protein